MVALTNQTIENSYGDLLQISNANNGADSTLRPIKDGKDDSTPLRLSLTQIQLDYAVWPGLDGSNGQVLTTDGAGNLSWTSASGSTQNLWLTVNADSGSTSADNTTDVLTIAGGTDISTSISGDVLTVNYTGSSSGITDIVQDTSPELGGNLDLNGFALTNINSTHWTDANGANLIRFSSGVGSTSYLQVTNGSAGRTELFAVGGILDLRGNSIIIDGLNWPTSDGTSGQVLTTDGAGNLSFTTVSGTDPTFTADSGTTTTNNLTVAGGTDISTSISGDILTVNYTGSSSGITAVVDDTTPQLGGNLDVNGFNITSVTDGNIVLAPDGLGEVIIDGLTYPSTDGTNGQVLTTDGAGNLSFTSASGGLSAVVDDTTPQLGGNLDLNNFEINKVNGTWGDINFNSIIGFSPQTSAVNYLKIENSATGDNPKLTVEGNDTDIGLRIQPKGSGNTEFYSDGISIYNNVGDPGFGFSTNTNAVNYIQFIASGTGLPPSISASGSDTNVDLSLKAKGSGGAVEIEELRYYTLLLTESSTTNSITFDTSDANIYEVALSENITSITLNNRSVGQKEQDLKIRFIQPSTGGPYTVSGWPASVKWPGGTAPTITQTNNAVDQIFLSTPDNGFTWYGNYSQDYS